MFIRTHLNAKKATSDSSVYLLEKNFQTALVDIKKSVFLPSNFND